MCGGYDFAPPVSEKNAYLLLNLYINVGNLLSDLGRTVQNSLLCEAIRDLSWVLVHALGILEVYLPTLIQSQGCVESTHAICMCVMELLGSGISHLSDFKDLFLLKNTCKHLLNCSSQVVHSLDL